MTVVRRRTRPGAAPMLRAALTVLVGILALLAEGCGNDDFQLGTPVLTIGATNNHFTTFMVSIDGISITRDDGTVITALGAVEPADLTQVVDLTEHLSAAALPNGTYKTGSVTLDFTTAVIYVDVNGQNVPATVVDSTGAAVTTATITFNLDPARPLVVNNAQSVRLAFDFDLAASTMVTATSSPATVVLNPFVVASVVPPNSNPIRARGEFVTADPGAGTFAFNTTPLIDVLDTFGAVNVKTTSATTFDINGTTYTGSAGVTAMKSLPLSTFVYAIGTYTDLTGVTPVLTATQVYAGTSVVSGAADHMSGNVSALNGNTFTVHGANLVSSLGTQSFTSDAVITVGSGTVVNVDGQATKGLTTAAISVGQHLDIYGVSATDASGNVTVDATAGEVRLQTTHVWGLVNTASPGLLDLNLLSIDAYEVPAYTFTGTGTSPANDATAASYAVDTGTIDESAVPANTLVRADGLVSPFGSAPPDFNASAVTLGSATQAVLQVEWVNGGTAAPFSSATSSGLVVDLTNANLGTVHEIDIGPTTLDLTTLSASPSIVPDPTNSTNFALGSGGLTSTVNTYNTYAGFLADANTSFTQSLLAIKLVAIGQYNAATNTFTATRIDLVE